jgi:hypothetical protein
MTKASKLSKDKFTFDITESEADPDDPNENYPPKGTEDACLLVNIDDYRFKMLGHTGRFFHAQCDCAGYDGEEIGIEGIPEEAGYWVMEKGVVSYSRDWESGVVDEVTISGEWRPALLEDFEKFNADEPECLFQLKKILKAAQAVSKGGTIQHLYKALDEYGNCS